MSADVHLSRRSLLAAVGTVAVAGCGGRSEESFWDDPPAFEPDGLRSVPGSSPPPRPAIAPVTFAPATVEGFRDRARNLLAPIPEPLTAETLPNGAIRSQIVEQRAAARDSLSSIEDNEAPTLAVAERLVAAREHAATAVGTWAAVTRAGSPGDVTPSRAAISGRISDLAAALPGPARTVREGVALYGAVERWLDVARRATAFGRGESVGGAADPLRTGSRAGEFERVSAQLDAGSHLRERYAATAEGVAADAVAADVEAVLERLAPRVEERLLERREGDAEGLLRYPETEAYLADSSLPRDAPSVRLLSRRLGDFFDDAQFDPIALPGYSPLYPLTTLRRTYRALCHLSAFDALEEHLAADDPFAPADGDEIRAAREAAIAAVESLADSEAPLERWLAGRLRGVFDRPDELVADLPAGEGTHRRAAEAYATYRWIELFSTTVSEVTGTVWTGDDPD